MTIGFHGQRPVDSWLQAIEKLPPGAPFLSVDNVHMLRDAKLTNPSILTVFRKKIWDQNFTPDLEEAKAKARAYFDSFIDGTWTQQELWRYVDIIKEWNEYVATSQNEEERQLIITWLTAVTSVWNEEYRGRAIVGYRDIPLACLSVAIGNDIDPRFAKIITDTGNIISYHNYTKFIDGQRDPLDAQYHSGRWIDMDAAFLAQGIAARWISTEGGPYYGVAEGWKHPRVLNGDFDAFLTQYVDYQLEMVSAWNAANGGRYLGSTIFTFGNTGSWPYYELNAGEMSQIADRVAAFQPEPPPDPDPGPDPGPEPEPGEEWKIEVWDTSIERQAISLNPTAALQAAIFADGYTPVQSEFYMTPSDGIERAIMAAENLATGDRRVYHAVVPIWDRVEWFTDPKV